MENEKKDSSRFEFLFIALQRVKRSNIEGSLAIYILITVILYNFVFFSIFANYGLYIFLPLVLAVLSYYLKYWKTKITWKLYLGFAMLQFALLWDFMVSASYLPNNGSYDYTSIPTLVLDAVGMLIGINWWMEYRDNDDISAKLDIKKD